jgi:hypothetical protein
VDKLDRKIPQHKGTQEVRTLHIPEVFLNQGLTHISTPPTTITILINLIKYGDKYLFSK